MLCPMTGNTRTFLHKSTNNKLAFYVPCVLETFFASGSIGLLNYPSQNVTQNSLKGFAELGLFLNE